MTRADKEAFWEAIDWTLRDTEIAKQIRRAPNRVRYWRRELRKPEQPLLVPRIKRHKRAAAIKKLRAQGLTLEAIAKRYGITRQYVDQILNVEKNRARAAAGWLNRWADLPTACQICNNIGELEKHHADYSKPLSIIWLCKACHLVADARRRQENIFEEINVDNPVC